MAKYDFNFKMKVVKCYLNGEGGFTSLSKKYRITNKEQIRQWVNVYKILGENGLKRKNKDTCYTVQFKLDVIDYMLITKSSAQEVANHFRMNNSSLIAEWKRKFLNGVVDALTTD